MKRSCEGVERSLLDFPLDGSQFFTLDVFELAACELIGPFERRAIFAQIGEPTLQIRIAPRRAWRRPLLLRCLRRGLRGLTRCWKRQQQRGCGHDRQAFHGREKSTAHKTSLDFGCGRYDVLLSAANQACFFTMISAERR